MAFSIEALQCKSKLYNMRQLEFTRNTFYPELMPRENETITSAATQQFKSALKSVMAKIKLAVGHSTVNAERINEADAVDFESVVASEDTNPEGFVEVSLIDTTSIDICHA